MIITKEIARRLASRFNVDLQKTPIDEYIFGLKTEYEHRDVIGDNKFILARIVNAHLKENPRSYWYLKQAGL